MDINSVVGLFNYWIVIVLMMTGFLHRDCPGQPDQNGDRS